MKHFLHKHHALALASFATLLFFAGCSNITSDNTTNSSKSEVSTTTNKKVDTSTWKTLRDDVASLEFRYPSDWPELKKEAGSFTELFERSSLASAPSKSGSGEELLWKPSSREAMTQEKEKYENYPVGTDFSIDPFAVDEKNQFAKIIKFPSGLKAIHYVATDADRQQISTYVFYQGDVRVSLIRKEQVPMPTNPEKATQEYLERLSQDIYDQMESTDVFSETLKNFALFDALAYTLKPDIVPSYTKESDTSLWKKYENKTLGFEVRYPQGWNTIESGDVVLLPRPIGAGGDMGDSLIVRLETKSLEKLKEEDKDVFDDVKFSTWKGYVLMEGLDEVGIFVRQVYVPIGDKLFSVGITDAKQNNFFENIAPGVVDTLKVL